MYLNLYFYRYIPNWSIFRSDVYHVQGYSSDESGQGYSRYDFTVLISEKDHLLKIENA